MKAVLVLIMMTLLIPIQSFAKGKSMEVVKINTSLGVIRVELDAVSAPETVKNFKRYVKEGFYNNTIFHRVIPGFMIQGGGFNTAMIEKKTHDPIINEADNGLKNDAYTIAMARTTIPDSATSQFFINVANNDFLNFTSKTMQGWGYAVFGKVIEGKDVVDAIAKVKTTSKGMHDDVPVENVVIKSIELE